MVVGTQSYVWLGALEAHSHEKWRIGAAHFSAIAAASSPQYD